jgi:hypothetical protein
MRIPALKTASEGEAVVKMHDNARLKDLLNEWKDIEPSPNFETQVWRRIHAGSASEPATILAVPLSACLPERVRSQSGGAQAGAVREWFFFHRTLWVNAAAAVVGIILGLWAGLSPPAQAGNSHSPGEPLLHSRTIAGSYLVMAAGGGK